MPLLKLLKWVIINTCFVFIGIEPSMWYWTTDGWSKCNFKYDGYTYFIHIKIIKGPVQEKWLGLITTTQIKDRPVVFLVHQNGNCVELQEVYNYSDLTIGKCKSKSIRDSKKYLLKLLIEGKLPK